MNVKLLRKIQEHISEEPRRLVMSIVSDRKRPGSTVEDDGLEFKAAKCGTVACIAGWACILTKQPYECMERAEVILGLDRHQSTRLFFSGEWGKFRAKWLAAKTPKSRATIAVARIDHFIKTKGRE